jgi:hypothetical protein
MQVVASLTAWELNGAQQRSNKIKVIFKQTDQNALTKQNLIFCAKRILNY